MSSERERHSNNQTGGKKLVAYCTQPEWKGNICGKEIEIFMDQSISCLSRSYQF